MLAINTCPEKETGIVSLLLEPFLDGLRESGAEVELCYASDLTTGNSTDSDKIQQLQQKISRTDVLVLASPLYFDGRTGPEGATPSLRKLLEGLVPGTQMPALRPDEHAVRKVREENVNCCKVVIASGSGFWETSGLCPALTHDLALCKDTFPEAEGNVAGTRSVLLRGPMPRGLIDWDVIAAAREAGCQLAHEEAESPTAHDIARREAVTRDFYYQIINSNASLSMTSYAMPAISGCKQK